MGDFSNAQLSAYVRQLNTRLNQLTQQNSILQQIVNELASRPRSVAEEIDAIPGRRIESTLSGEIGFDATAVGTRAAPVVMPVSQDGPFVMTHYPMVVWRPSAPNNATNLNRWRPVTSFPLPTQQITTDFIDIGYELQDGGNQRLFQNQMRGPMLSRPDNLVPCPVPTLWSPNSNVILQPTYLSVTFSGAVAPTAGILHVDIPGYRIVNL